MRGVEQTQQAATSPDSPERPQNRFSRPSRAVPLVVYPPTWIGPQNRSWGLSEAQAEVSSLFCAFLGVLLGGGYDDPHGADANTETDRA